MNGVSFVTVCTRSRLAEAAVLARSLQTVHPGVPRLLYLAEGDRLPADASCGWDVRTVEPADLPGGRRFLFQYAPFELCCALKPFILAAALREPGAEGALYLDSDMLALAPFLDLVEVAWREADVWLTPHLRTLAPSPAFPALLHNGAYNAGFLAVRNAPDGLRFLGWLRDRLARDCVRDFGNGQFVDQKWLDLAASLCPGVRSLAHPGLNAGHWNLHEHDYTEGADGALLLDGAVTLALFHFSGLTETVLSVHQPGLAVPPAILSLAGRYRAERAARQVDFPSAALYSWGTYRDGTPIQPAHREAVRLGRFTGDDPFSNRSAVETAAAGLTPPAGSRAEALAADLQLRRLRAHPVIGRVWRFWKQWVNHDLP